LPLIGGIIEKWFFDGDGLIFLPQDRVIQINQPLDLPGEMVLPSQVVEYFIEQASARWIMNTCLCRDAKQCQDYPIELGCLFLGEAADGINPKLGRPVSKEEALAHVQRCRQAGLVHLIGRNKLDTVWLGVGPGDRLLTICNCGPCCCLWHVLPYTASHIGAKIMRMPGVSVVVNDGCVGCGVCAQGLCFVNAIELVDGRAVVSEACRGCGRCVDACPEGAIGITIEHGTFVQESITRIGALVDVS
jgi:ferredoxin